MKNNLHLKLLLGVLLLSLLSGCDRNESNRAIAKKANQTTSQYSVWPTKTQITGEKLSEELTNDVNYADHLCSIDANRPSNYSTHFALISTHQYDRIDLIEKYELDEDQPVLFGNTDTLLADHLGTFIQQKGTTNVEDAKPKRAGTETIKLTFSERGQFTGYCEANFGYTNSIMVDSDSGDMRTFSVSCKDTPASVVCMSIK